MNLDEVSSRIEIYEALMRYCRGIDRAIPELVESAFHPDGIDDHGPGRVGSARDLAARSVPRKHAALPRVGQHMITNFLVNIQGDRANCESSWFAVDPGESGYALGGGRYLDRFERRDGDWRIAHRTVVVDWTRDYEDFDVLEKTLPLPHGALGEADPAHGFLEDFEVLS